MQSASSREIDQYYYRRNQLVHVSLDQANNSKDSKTKESKPKAQKPKVSNSNSNNSSCLDPGGNAKTFDKAQKEKKKQWRREKRNKKNSNTSTLASGVNTTSNSSKKKRVQTDLSQVTCWNCNKKSHYLNNYPKLLKPKN